NEIGPSVREDDEAVGAVLEPNDRLVHGQLLERIIARFENVVLVRTVTDATGSKHAQRADAIQDAVRGAVAHRGRLARGRAAALEAPQLLLELVGYAVERRVDVLRRVFAGEILAYGMQHDL